VTDGGQTDDAADTHASEEKAEPRGGDNKRRRRSLAFIGAAASAFLIAIVTAFGTGVGQDLFSNATKSSPSGPPVKVAAVTVERTADQSGTYVFANNQTFPSTQLDALNQLEAGSSHYDNWFRSRGAVDPDVSEIKLVVVGNRPSPVAITGMSVARRCGPPLGGTLFYSPPAGAEMLVGVGFDLDSTDSAAQNYENGRLSGDYFGSHFISLHEGEIETFEITAVTKNYCEFTLNLQTVDGSSTKTETIRDGSQPFRVTALVQNPGFGPGDLSHYHVLYVGGVAPGAGPRGGFVQQDPVSYSG
jgi:hypothetical protein